MYANVLNKRRFSKLFAGRLQGTELEKRDLHNEAFISIKERLTKILDESKNINDPKPIDGHASVSDEMNNFALNPRKMPEFF